VATLEAGLPATRSGRTAASPGTLGGTLEVPTVTPGTRRRGTAKVKERLRSTPRRAGAQGAADRETKSHDGGLIPKGMNFWGPPGTGKTLFAKAVARRIAPPSPFVSGGI